MLAVGSGLSNRCRGIRFGLSMPLRIETRRIEGEILVLEISGRMTRSHVAALGHIKTIVEDLVQQNRKMVIFDLTSVAHIDSAAMGLILACGEMLVRSGGRRLGVAASEKIEWLLRSLRIGCLGILIDLHRTVAEVSQSFTLPSDQRP